jgi:hypothetical protein
LLLSVAHKDEDPVFLLLELKGQSHARSGRKTLAEHSRVPFDTRNAGFYVTGENRAAAPKSLEEIFFFYVAEFAKHAVDARADMAHADYEPVASLPARIVGLVRHSGIEH